jgi:hypothetical protein
MKKIIKEFEENFVIDVGIGADNNPYQNCHKNNNGKCDFVRKQDIIDFLKKAYAKGQKDENDRWYGAFKEKGLI